MDTATTDLQRPDIPELWVANDGEEVMRILGEVLRESKAASDRQTDE